jgi:hypothetical protein
MCRRPTPTPHTCRRFFFRTRLFPEACFLNVACSARHVGLRSGVPVHVPALTVNRLCGSGFQSVVNGAQDILLGESSVVLTGGSESMSSAPCVSLVSCRLPCLLPSPLSLAVSLVSCRLPCLLPSPLSRAHLYLNCISHPCNQVLPTHRAMGHKVSE